MIRIIRHPSKHYSISRVWTTFAQGMFIYIRRTRQWPYLLTTSETVSYAWLNRYPPPYSNHNNLHSIYPHESTEHDSIETSDIYFTRNFPSRVAAAGADHPLIHTSRARTWLDPLLWVILSKYYGVYIYAYKTVIYRRVNTRESMLIHDK